MNTLIVAAIRCSLMFLLPALAYTGSAQCDLNSVSGDWNTAENWKPTTVPMGQVLHAFVMSATKP
jgi:hypothetical protein